MKITYLDHSGFAVEQGETLLVFDEYTIASGFMGMPEFSIPASMVEALQNG